MNETIINGIDVSECYFYGDNNCDVGYIADSYPKNCKNNPNCYFKQLKRLEKENKRIQSERDLSVIKYNNLVLSVISDIPFNGEILDREYSIEDHIYKMQNALKALEEIKEMLKESMSLKLNAYNHFINVEKAIDKVNEVLNEK